MSMHFVTEVSSKNKEEELSSIIVELRKNLASAQEKLAKEQAEKLVTGLYSSHIQMVSFHEV